MRGQLLYVRAICVCGTNIPGSVPPALLTYGILMSLLLCFCYIFEAIWSMNFQAIFGSASPPTRSARPEVDAPHPAFPWFRLVQTRPYSEQSSSTVKGVLIGKEAFVT